MYLLHWVNGMLDFIYTVFVELLGMERERKMQMKIYVSSGIRTHACTAFKK